MLAPSLSWKETKQLLSIFYPPKPSFLPADYPDLSGKVVIVTGGNTGVGYHTAKLMAAACNAKVYVLSRNEEKTKLAIERIEKEAQQEFNKNVKLQFIKLDLGDLTTIKQTANEFLKNENRIDIIIHNAGVMTPPMGSKTTQGYDLQWGTNVLGPFLLQKFLDPLFIQTSKKNPPNLSRVVWVSSTAHFHAPANGGIYWDDVNFADPSKKYNNGEIYGQSKAGVITNAIQWSKRHSNENIISVCLCPGVLKTDLQRHLPGIVRSILGLLMYDAVYGAYTEMYAAASPEVPTESNEHKMIISFGRFGIIRKDIDEGANGENGKKYWNYAEKEVSKYL
mmetsp:Transcript_8651/g.10791  ORF Transcript_8651/g.10791 Transcript_8651/m.10791 type:complete len:336 (+) Transcript_8651:18-1025(+)